MDTIHQNARSGRWEILETRGEYRLCKCDCGTIRKVCYQNLRKMLSKSCGCLRSENLVKKMTTHGLCGTRGYRRQYDMSNWSRHLLTKAKTRCKKQGIAFDLTVADIPIPDICPVLGIPIFPSSSGRTWNTPTLDRIIPEKGYIKGNVVVVSWRANSLKSDATLEEIRRLFNFYAAD